MPVQGRALKFLQQTVRTLPDENQLDYVLARIAAEVNAAVLIFDIKGGLVGSIGGAPHELIWESVEKDVAQSKTQIGRWTTHARRLGPNREGFTLVFATRVAEGIEAPSEVIDAAEIAVNAVLAVIRGSDARWVRENAELLEALEKGIPQAREHRFWPRLAEFGFTAYTSFLVIVDESVDGQLPSSEFMWTLHERSYSSAVPLLAAARLAIASSDAIIHMLMPDTSETRNWLKRDFTGRAVGISDPHYSLTDVPIGLREAEYAQRFAISRAKARLRAGQDSDLITEMADYRKLRLGAWSAVVSPNEQFRARKRNLLAPFDQYAEILDTVITFLANDLSVNDTAHKLFLHPNTIRYRLGRAEDLLGGSLSSPLMLTDLTLALEAEIWAHRKQS